jgi:hypothetical protein
MAARRILRSNLVSRPYKRCCGWLGGKRGIFFGRRCGMPIMNRRSLLGSILFAFATSEFSFNWIASAGAQQKTWRHGLSLFGDLKYPTDFKHFDYVNPNAPKGGSVRSGRNWHF